MNSLINVLGDNDIVSKTHICHEYLTTNFTERPFAFIPFAYELNWAMCTKKQLFVTCRYEVLEALIGVSKCKWPFKRAYKVFLAY